ncbi:hypothetical protein Q7P37_007143 [Cladosporium fusiforme]
MGKGAYMMRTACRLLAAAHRCTTPIGTPQPAAATQRIENVSKMHARAARPQNRKARTPHPGMRSHIHGRHVLLYGMPHTANAHQPRLRHASAQTRQGVASLDSTAQISARPAALRVTAAASKKANTAADPSEGHMQAAVRLVHGGRSCRVAGSASAAVFRVAALVGVTAPCAVAHRSVHMRVCIPTYTRVHVRIDHLGSRPVRDTHTQHPRNPTPIPAVWRTASGNICSLHAGRRVLGVGELRPDACLPAVY